LVIVKCQAIGLPHLEIARDDNRRPAAHPCVQLRPVPPRGQPREVEVHAAPRETVPRSSDLVPREPQARRRTTHVEEVRRAAEPRFVHARGALRLAVGNLVSLQIAPNDLSSPTDSSYLVGAIRVRADSIETRVDTTQHTIEALREVLRVW